LCYPRGKGFLCDCEKALFSIESKLPNEKEIPYDHEFDKYIKDLPTIETRTEDDKLLYPNSSDPWD